MKIGSLDLERQTIEKGILRHHVGNCSVCVCAFKTNKIKGVYSPADPGVCEMLLSIAFIEGLEK